MLVKILGLIDLLSAVLFLVIIFGISAPLGVVLFCISLLFLKGLFIFTGDLLSIIDAFSAIILIISLFSTIPIIFLWIPVFLLLGKGFLSFL